ncbi:MAG TPA: hypothetical protein VHE30_18100 [Polyangiaceae bacterium]|nr:hypothetical protein [Polyangiaceae bacterium]
MSRRVALAAFIGCVACDPRTPATAPASAVSPPSVVEAPRSDAPPLVAAMPQSAPPSADPSRPTAACGRLPNEPVHAERWPYGKDAACDRAATVWANVPHEDRACRTDEDCTVVSGDGNCINLAIAKRAASRPEYAQTPCGNPASGACPGGRATARCQAGCCAVR